MPEDPTPITPRTFPAVVPRSDPRLGDETQLLVRFSTDKEAEHALSNAHLYRSVPGYETCGAVTISVYVVFDAAEARTMAAARGVFGLCSVGRVRSHGSEVVATSVFDEAGRPALGHIRHGRLAYRRWRRPCRFAFDMNDAGYHRPMSDRREDFPLLPADLTWVKVNGGHGYGRLSNWDEDAPPELVSRSGPRTVTPSISKPSSPRSATMASSC